MDVSSGGKVINQFIDQKVLNEIRFTLAGQIAGPFDLSGLPRPTLFPREDRFSFDPNTSPKINWKAVRGIGENLLFVRGLLEYRHDKANNH